MLLALAGGEFKVALVLSVVLPELINAGHLFNYDNYL
jgi:hypothetical protein